MIADLTTTEERAIEVVTATLRERFEAWAGSYGHDCTRQSMPFNAVVYQSNSVNALWAAFQKGATTIMDLQIEGKAKKAEVQS